MGDRGAGPDGVGQLAASRRAIRPGLQLAGSRAFRPPWVEMGAGRDDLEALRGDVGFGEDPAVSASWLTGVTLDVAGGHVMG